jgi:hypothetical protein
MEGESLWEGAELETIPFLDMAQGNSTEEQQPTLAKKIWNRVFGVFVSITIGVYIGFSCVTMQDAWIHAASFCGEALICACVAGIVKTPSFKRSIFGIALYFTISAVSTPIACWLGLQLAIG